MNDWQTGYIIGLITTACCFALWYVIALWIDAHKYQSKCIITYVGRDPTTGEIIEAPTNNK